MFIAGTAAFRLHVGALRISTDHVILVVARMGQGAAAALVVSDLAHALVNTLFGGADRRQQSAPGPDSRGCSLRSARLSVGYWWIPGPGVGGGSF